MVATFVPGAGNLSLLNVYVKVSEPMLFSAVNEFGDTYFVSYAEPTENGEAWILKRVKNSRLEKFESGLIDIRDMFINNDFGHVIHVEFDDDQPNHPKIKYFLLGDADLEMYLARPGKKIPVVLRASAWDYQPHLEDLKGSMGANQNPSKPYIIKFDQPAGFIDIEEMKHG